MGALRRALARIYSFFRKPPLDADFEAEIAAHIEMAIKRISGAASPHRKPAARRWSALAAWIW
jgi:hypothetical protein